MTTEAEQADQVMDVFGEAFMKLVRQRLRLTVNAYHVDKGKVQVRVVLEDNGAVTAPTMISEAMFTISSDLNVDVNWNNHHVPYPGR